MDARAQARALHAAQVWRTQVLRRHVERTRAAMALEHDRQRRVLAAWVAWRRHTLLQRRASSQQRRALAFAAQACMARAWDAWVIAYQHRTADGMRVWVFLTQRRILRAWHALTRTGRATAGTHSRGWRALQHRRRRSLLRRAWHALRDEVTGRRARRTAAYFAAWRAALAAVRRERQATRLGTVLLQRRVLRRLCRAVEQTASKHDELQHTSQRMLCARMWFHWMLLTRRRQRTHSDALAVAVAADRRRRLVAAVRVFALHCLAIRTLRDQLHLADDYFDGAVVHRCFRAWKRYTLVRRRKTQLSVLAGETALSLLLQRMWRRWRCAYTLRFDDAYKWQVAETHHRRCVKRRGLLFWRSVVRQQVRDARVMTAAAQYYRRRVLDRAVQQWRRFTDASMHAEAQWRRAVRHHYLGSLHVSWSAWRLFIVQQRAQGARWSIAVAHSRRSLRRRTLSAWISYTQARRMRRQQAVLADRVFRGKALLRAMRAWRVARVAVHLAARTTMRRCFDNWLDWAIVAQQERAVEDAQVREARHAINTGIKARVLTAWLDAHMDAVVQRVQHARAEQHARRVAMRSALRVLRQYTAYRKVRAAAKRKADVFAHAKLTRWTFRHWRDAWTTQQRVRISNMRALQHWAICVTDRALQAWIVLLRRAQYRRRCQNRARQLHSSFLVRRVVSVWLEAAAAARARRSAFAAAQHAASAQQVFLAVERCARHWRRRTLLARGRRIALLDEYTTALRPPPRLLLDQAVRVEPPVDQGVDHDVCDHEDDEELDAGDVQGADEEQRGAAAPAADDNACDRRDATSSRQPDRQAVVDGGAGVGASPGIDIGAHVSEIQAKLLYYQQEAQRRESAEHQMEQLLQDVMNDCATASTPDSTTRAVVSDLLACKAARARSSWLTPSEIEDVRQLSARLSSIRILLAEQDAMN